MYRRGVTNGLCPLHTGDRGTTFGTDASIATRRVIVGCDGVVGTAAGMICGGSTSYSSRTTATEEYTQGSTALNIKTVSTS